MISCELGSGSLNMLSKEMVLQGFIRQKKQNKPKRKVTKTLGVAKPVKWCIFGSTMVEAVLWHGHGF